MGVPVTRLVWPVLLLLPLAACGSFRTACYRRVDLDAATLTLHPRDSVGILECPQDLADGYERFTTATGQHVVNHLGPWIDPATPAAGRVRWDAFTLSADYHLISRDKMQLLARGPYGAVCGLTTFYYDPRYAGQPTTFDVRSVDAGAGGASCEPPVEVATRPANAALDGISLVRVLQHPAGYLVVSANYRPGGELSAVHVFGTKGGVWVDLPPDYVSGQGTLGFSSTAAGAAPGRFWLPESFPLESFLQTQLVALVTTPYPEVEAIVHLHFAKSRWVEQRVVAGAGRGGHRTLQFAETPEDRTLAPVDARRAFGHAPRVEPR